MNILLKHKNNKIIIGNVIEYKGINKFVGLMFKQREKSSALQFNIPNQAIHSLFVFFPFVAVWLDDKNNVVDSKIVKPFQLYVKSRKPFNKLIEIPLNKKYKEISEKLLNCRR
ncbi:DUF192 domain-containing protein [Candidatus Pacearchaeota archaeon]|nr:DUF192 domain-containing protein [Candidatus Pacearchaeota archaeon]